MKQMITVLLTVIFVSACTSTKPVITERNNALFEERAKEFWKKNGIKSSSDGVTASANKVRSNKHSSFQCSKNRSKPLSKSLNVVSLSFFDAELREALLEVSMMANIPIVLDDTVEGLVTANFEGESLSRVLDILLASGNYSYKHMNRFILVGGSTPDSPSFSQLATTCRYKPLYTQPLDLAASLTPYYQQFVRVPANADFFTITAPDRVQKQIKQHIEIFDRQPGQVLLELSVVEVSRSALSILGVSWRQFGLDANTQRMRSLGVGEWNGVEALSTKNALDAFSIGALPQRTLASSLQFLRDEGQADLKAMPAIVALDGSEAVFSTTHRVWMPLAAEGGGTARTQELVYGVEMRLVPRIADNGEVTLRIINASVSDLNHSAQGLPHIIAHNISSVVSVNDGDYLVLGGLLQTKKHSQHTGVPNLKDAALVGGLFGQKEQRSESIEVLIMIRPKILQPHV